MRGFVYVLFSLLFCVCYANHLANVKAIHAIPDGPDVDVYIGGALSNSGVAYGSVSTYVPFPEGEYLFQITEAGVSPDTSVLISKTVSLEGGEYYTFAAIGSLANPSEFPLDIFVIEDEIVIPEERALLRTLYLSPSETNVDVFSDSETFWEDIAYPSAGDPEYLTLNANFPYKITVRSTIVGSTVALAGPTFVTMLPNTASTIYVIGISQSKSSPLTIVYAQDFITGQVSPSTTRTRTPSQTPTMTPTAAASISATATRSFNTSATRTASRTQSVSRSTIVTRSPFRVDPGDDDDGGFTPSPSPLFATPFVSASGSSTPNDVVFATPTANPEFSPFLSRTPFRDTQNSGDNPLSSEYVVVLDDDESSSSASMLFTCVFLVVCTLVVFI